MSLQLSDEAGKANRLRADGWIDCENGRGGGHSCSACVHGLVPPPWMLEAACRLWPGIKEILVREILVAAARATPPEG